MKLLLVCLYTAMVVFFPGPASSAGEGTATIIESIHFLEEKEGGDTLRFQLNGDTVPKVFELGGENPRLVLDFIDVGYSRTAMRVIPADGMFVKRIRIGVHNQPVAKTRVVIDLQDDAAFDFEKEFIRAEMALVVRIVPVGIADKGKRLPEADGGGKLMQRPVPKAEVPLPSAKPVPGEKPPETATPVVEEKKEQPLVAAAVEPARPLPQAEEHTTDDASVGGREGKVIPERDEDPPILLKVNFEKTTNNKEMILFTLNGFYPPVIFAVEEQNPRIVCEFLDARLGPDVRATLNSDGRFINKVVVAKSDDPDKVRVVLDLVADKNYDLKQVFFKEDNLFVVIISDLTGN
jgi:hypothetical protein